MHSELVVLGGGPGGYAAAFLAADEGMEVTIVESESKLGGTCLHRGCVPAKEFLEDGEDALDFLVALLNVAIVLDATKNDSAFTSDESGCICWGSNFLTGTVAKGIEIIGRKNGLRLEDAGVSNL